MTVIVKQRGAVVVPKLLKTEDEYTPEERAIVNARLEKARKGPHFGPFNTAEEAITHMKGQLGKRAANDRHRQQ